MTPLEERAYHRLRTALDKVAAAAERAGQGRYTSSLEVSDDSAPAKPGRRRRKASRKAKPKAPAGRMPTYDIVERAAKPKKAPKKRKGGGKKKEKVHAYAKGQASRRVARQEAASGGSGEGGE